MPMINVRKVQIMKTYIALAFAALFAFSSMAAASERHRATGNQAPGLTAQIDGLTAQIDGLTAQIDGITSAGSAGRTNIRGN